MRNTQDLGHKKKQIKSKTTTNPTYKVQVFRSSYRESIRETPDAKKVALEE